MISPSDINEILSSYNLSSPSEVTIGVLGGHSGLDVCHGAKKLGFKTLAVCQKGRDKTYSKYFRSHDKKGCVDETIVLDSFEEVLHNDVQNLLTSKNTIFVHNRYFWVYFNDFKKVENDFRVPIFGTRNMVRMEERDASPNQYDLLDKGGIRMPKILRSGGQKVSDGELQSILDKHDGPMLVKSAEEARSFERDFFVVMNFEDYEAERAKRNADIVDSATIEEYVIGPQINFNYFYSPLTGEVEIMGTDTRRQTNLDGFLRLTASDQMKLSEKGFSPSMVENGHIACTTKESIIEKMFELGEKFVEVSKTVTDTGIIGPFALQGAYVSEKGREEFVTFDVSMRIPGSPGTRFTPHTGYLWGETLSYGERIAMEIKEGMEQGKLGILVT
jgi:5-formaminoimidazole-4-carboxamide-1-(beta)-D-ribofuranosyl 5'-monophosphate synthetase